MRIKKGDNVIIIAGKDKGKRGKIIKVFSKEKKIIVENVNLKSKHQRPKTAGKKGEKIEVPRAFSASSAMLLCKNCGKPTRVGHKILADNPPGGEASKKIRICKKCDLEI